MLSRTKAVLQVFAFAVLLHACSLPSDGQTNLPDADKWAELASFHYGVNANIVYGVFNNMPVHLDVWENHTVDGSASPTLVYFHGGGWIFGDKGGAPNLFLPYVQRGWNVVNVEYRMAPTSNAPAAVEDSRCALRWVYSNAEKYHFDLSRIVLTGHSAGGHLALITGMLPKNSELDDACPQSEDTPELRPAAIVNWYGISDVNELLSGPDRKTYAVMWVGSAASRHDVAKQTSPMTYVRHDQPPVISIHGDQDPTVPYSQSVNLKKALDQAGVKNELVTIPGGSHGSFSDEQTLRAFGEIWKFLDAVMPKTAGAKK